LLIPFTAPFWAEKQLPTPVSFDVNNEMHISFIRAAAVLKANMLGLPAGIFSHFGDVYLLYVLIDALTASLCQEHGLVLIEKPNATKESKLDFLQAKNKHASRIEFEKVVMEIYFLT
jgi:hypothetical protein